MEQRNSVQFIILTFLVSIVLIVVAFGVSSAVNAISGKADASYFGSETYIGPVKVDGLSKEQAILILTQETESWKSEQNTTIQFLFEKEKLDLQLIDFDLQTSVNQAISGERNTLLFQLKDLHTVYEGLSLTDVEGLDFERFEADLLSYANHLTELPNKIYLTEYLVESSEETMTFASETISIPESDVSASNWARKHVEIAVKEDGIFSLNEIFTKESDGLYSEGFQNDLASAIYKAALNSPFTIVERHITTDNRHDQEVGFEAFIDAQHDLKIKNEYSKPLRIQSSVDNGELTISIVGESSPLTIKAFVKEEKTLKPRVVVYPVETVSEEYEEEGKSGVQATVVRTITIGDSIWKTYTHSVDSYLPIPVKWYRVFEENEEEVE